jgi:hypothetical protein
MINRRETQTLKSLILVSFLERERSFHFSRFVQIVINLVPKWVSNWCVWVPLRPESWQKLGLQNMYKTVTKKVPTSVQICFKKRVQKSGRLVVFRVPIPAWSPGRPRGGSKAQKYLKMEPRTYIFYDFRTLLSLSLETLWKYFVCSMNNKLIVLDVKFTFLFA